MNASQTDWGIELETTIQTSDDTPIGPYHRGYQVPWLPTGWKAEKDSSIRPTAPNRKGCEFVSPKLRGYEGLEEVELAVEKIRERGARVNGSCGIHISVSFNGDAAALARLITLVANHEKGLYASTGTRRREQHTYSKAIKRYGNENEAKTKCEEDRFHLLNLTHLARGRNRIEFRCFAGSLNATKISGYVQLCLGLVELATQKTRRSSWSYDKKNPNTKSCWDRPGHGETELNRLFYRLGWTTGWYKGVDRHKKYGELSNGELAPDLKAIKKKLMEMAKKYDLAA